MAATMQIESAEDRLIDRVTAGQQEALERVEAAGRAVIEGLDRSRDEIAGFVAERIRQDLDTHCALMRCRSIDDVRLVQARHLATAMSQYGEETARLMGLGRALAGRSLGKA